MKISGDYATLKYLKIQDASYMGFLHALPLAVDNESCAVIDGQYKEEDYFTEFTFTGVEYELCLHQGAWYFGGHSEEDMASVPLPRYYDDLIKTRILKTFDKEVEVSQFAQIYSADLPRFIAVLQNNLLIDGVSLTHSQVLEGLIRIQEARMLIRRKGLIRWYAVSWVLMIHFGTIDMDTYKMLAN